MGAVGSRFYAYGKRLAAHYNAENRAYKFLDKGNLPPAPQHKIKRPPKEVALSREALEDIHCKNIELNEHLKKVYLTSTSVITGTPSKRPKPKKENEGRVTRMFYEPPIPQLGFCTLTNVVEILINFESDSDEWNLNAIAEKYKLDKKDVANLVMYYSLYRKEEFDFMNKKVMEDSKEVIEWDVNNQLEKKPLRRVDSK